MNAYISGIGWVFPNSSGYREVTVVHENKRNSLPELTRKDVLSKPYKPFGRMDNFSKLGFAALSFALRDAGLDIRGRKNNTAIIGSTVQGCLPTDVNYYQTVIPDGGARSSPALFAYTLPNCFIGEASIFYGLTGESFVINEAETKGLKGLSMSLGILESGLSDIVLCGICDSEKPDIDDLEENHIPGSLFFVIEKEKRTDVFCYGVLEEDISENKLVFNNEPISDLIALGKKCLGRDF